MPTNYKLNDETSSIATEGNVHTPTDPIILDISSIPPMLFSKGSMREPASLDEEGSEVSLATCVAPPPMRLESRKRRACDSSMSMSLHTPNSRSCENRKPQKVGTPLSIEEKHLTPVRPNPSMSPPLALLPINEPIHEWQRTPEQRIRGDNVPDSPMYSLQGLSLRSPVLKSPAIARSPGSSFSQVPQSPRLMQSPASSFSPFSGGRRHGSLIAPKPGPSPVRQVPVTILSHQHPYSSPPKKTTSMSSSDGPRPRGNVSTFSQNHQREARESKSTRTSTHEMSSGIFFPVNDFMLPPKARLSSKPKPKPSPSRSYGTVKPLAIRSPKKTTNAAPQYAPRPRRVELRDVGNHSNLPSFPRDIVPSGKTCREDAVMDNLVLGFTSQAKCKHSSPFKRSIPKIPHDSPSCPTVVPVKPLIPVHLSSIDKESSSSNDNNHIHVPAPTTSEKHPHKSISYLRPRSFFSDESKADTSDSEQSLENFFLGHPPTFKNKGLLGPRPFSPLVHNNSRLSMFTSTGSLYGMDIIHENSASKASLCEGLPKTKSRCFSEDYNGTSIRQSTSESSLASSIGLNLDSMPSFSDLSARDIVTPPAMAYSLSGPPPIRQTLLTSSEELETPPRKYLPSVEPDHCSLDKFCF